MRAHVCIVSGQGKHLQLWFSMYCPQDGARHDANSRTGCNASHDGVVGRRLQNAVGGRSDTGKPFLQDWAVRTACWECNHCAARQLFRIQHTGSLACGDDHQVLIGCFLGRQFRCREGLRNQCCIHFITLNHVQQPWSGSGQSEHSPGVRCHHSGFAAT